MKVWATGADVVLEPEVMVDCGVSLASVEEGPGVTELSTQEIVSHFAYITPERNYCSSKKEREKKKKNKKKKVKEAIFRSM